jgi:hypothetical protein
MQQHQLQQQKVTVAAHCASWQDEVFQDKLHVHANQSAKDPH